MRRYLVAIRRDPSIDNIIAALDFFLAGSESDDPFVLLPCNSVGATDHGLVRLEPSPKDGQQPPVDALSIPPHLICWTVEIEEGRVFPPGFAG